MQNNDKYVLFWSGPFSNWYPSKFKMKTEYGTRTFNCGEQAMMFHKAKMFGDNDAADEIMKEHNPKYQKAIGRKVKNFNAQKWDNACVNIVTAISIAKFQNNPDLLEILMNTEDKIIVEASPVDTIWGIGLAPDDPKALDEKNWKGKNYLGICLMRAREVLKAREE